MSDYSKLKRLAEAAISPDSLDPVVVFRHYATPSVILALIEENERLSGECEGCPMAIAEALRIERDQLKAENEALRKDADRYQWLRDEADFSDFEALCYTAIDGWAAYIDGCETCQGSGEIDQTLGGEWNSGVVPCPDCDGHGR